MRDRFNGLAMSVSTGLIVCGLTASGHAQQSNPLAGKQADQEQVVEFPGGLGEFAVGVLNLRVGDVVTAMHPNLLNEQFQGFAAGRAYVLQLDGPITPARRTALEQIGVRLGDYLPAYAYVTTFNATTPAQIAGLGFVTWVGEYQAMWKVDPEVGRQNWQTPERQALRNAGNAIVDITLFETAAVDQAIANLAAIPGTIIHRQEDIAGNLTFTANISLNAVPQIATMAAVQYIEEAPEVTERNSSTRWIVQSNVNGLTPLYNAGITGVGQIVGVTDGRVNVTHCSFVDSVNPIGNNHRKIQAYNTTTGYAQHGTHVAGTAIGDGGTTGDTRGIAYGGRLVFSVTPSFTETGAYNAFNTQFGQGARVITNSWGNDGTTAYDGLCRGVDDFSYDLEDALVLFAVTNTSTLKNPENAKNLLAVGASQDANNQANHSSGGAGPTSDQRRKPEIYAPGAGTISSSGSGTTCTTASLSGTSMASPAVAGTALLARQYYAQGFYPSGAANASDAFTPTGALLKATLLNSSVDMTGVSGYPSNLEGWGRVLLDNALMLTGESRRLLAYQVRNNAGLSTGQQTDRGFNVTSNAQRLVVTLVFTDPAASAGASNAWINDLDLEVTGPGGTYLGNVFTGGQSSTGGTKDQRNNVEMVQLAAPAVGAYTARVKGAAVSSGLQGYALVITGAVTGGLPAPINDQCSAASIVAAGSHSFTTIGATTDGPDEPGACNFGGFTNVTNDVWYRFLAQCTGTATISLCGADYDAKLAVYGSSCPVDGGSTLACADNTCGSAPEITMPVVSGTVYRVRVGGTNGATGSGTMVITCTVPVTCPADIAPVGGNGTVNVEDLLAVIGAWGACGDPGNCPADIAPAGGNDLVNVEDLLAIIGAWGGCP